MDIFFYATLGTAALIALISLIYYMPRLLCWFFAAKPQQRLTNDKRNKLAIIIPARNEIKAIPLLIESIKRQTYKREDFDFFVAVKEETDPVIKLAEENGGIAYVVSNQTCKGDALDYTMQRILKERPGQYGGFIIVDADCVLDDAFLEEMNNGLAAGRHIVQAKKLVKNYYYDTKNTYSLQGSCNGIIWTIIDELGNRRKSDKNITNMTIGTGIMLRADLVEKLGGWPYRATLTEDIELMYDCVANNYTTLYYSYAKIYVEEATKLSATNKRRSRWLNGIINSKREYKKKLKALPRTKEVKRNIYYACALEPVYVYIGALSIYSAFALIAAIPLAILSSPYWLYFLLAGLCSLGLIYISFFFLTLTCMIVDGKYMRVSVIRKLLILLGHPIFYMWYILIIGKHLVVRKTAKWKVIERADFGSQKRVMRRDVLKSIAECEKKGAFDVHTDPVDYSLAKPVDKNYRYNRKGFFRAIADFFPKFFILRPITLYINMIKYRTKVYGRKNLRQVGPAIATLNHVNMFDCLVAKHALKHRKVFITAADFNNRKDLLGKLMRVGGMMPLSQNMDAQRNFRTAMTQKLKKKRTVILFYPEQALWWNYEKPRPYKNGAYYYAAKFNLPIIPMFITFVERKKTDSEGISKRKFRLHIMPPVYPIPGKSLWDNVHYLKDANFEMCKAKYEEFYGRTLEYDVIVNNTGAACHESGPQPQFS